jgi:predicted transcriptional regulator
MEGEAKTSCPIVDIPREFLAQECRELISEEEWSRLPQPMKRFMHYLLSDIERFLGFHHDIKSPLRPDRPYRISYQLFLQSSSNVNFLKVPNLYVDFSISMTTVNYFRKRSKLKIEYDFFSLRNMSMTSMTQIVEKVNELAEGIKTIQENLTAAIELLKTDNRWEPVKDHPRYIIERAYPHTIKVEKTGKIVSTYQDKTKGNYFTVRLDGKRYYLHHLLAVQFLDNPNNYTQVDHIDRDKSNNNINNLRWCSPMQNMNNKVADKLVDELPESAKKIESYNGHAFEDLWYWNGSLWRFNHVNYKKISQQSYRYTIASTGYYSIVTDKNKERIKIDLGDFVN